MGLLPVAMKIHSAPSSPIHLCYVRFWIADVIVSIDLDGNVRRMNDIYFRPIHRNQYFEEMKA